MGVPCCCSKCKLVAFAANVFNRNEVFWSAIEVNMAPTPMDFFDLANLLDNDGNLQNEMMVGQRAVFFFQFVEIGYCIIFLLTESFVCRWPPLPRQCSPQSRFSLATSSTSTWGSRRGRRERRREERRHQWENMRNRKGGWEEKVSS